jgi:hypothetical protein
MFVLGNGLGNKTHGLLCIFRSDAAEASVHEEGRAAAALGATILMQLGAQNTSGM